MFNNRKKTAEGRELPRHIAIIMDGNGRWAKNRGLPRTAGHVEGVEAFRRIANHCKDIGVEYLTVYAFSTENWRRPAVEVEAIMGLLEKHLLEELESLERDRRRICFFGDITVLTPRLRKLCEEVQERSSVYEEGQVNICLNYGARDEILRAARRWAAEGCPELTEESFSGYLWSAGVPDPDLLIRPGGEKRISNYLLWQLAYTEFYFTDKLWPDFQPEDLDEAIAVYQKRERRFGDVGKSGETC